MVSQVVERSSTAAPLLADETDAVLAKLRARLVEAAENDAKLGRAQKISRHCRHIAGTIAGKHSRVISPVCNLFA